MVLVGGDLAHLEREADVLVDRHVGVEAVALEDHRDVAVLGLELVDHAVADPDFALGDLFEASDHAHGGGLAAARGPEQDEEFLVGDVEVEIVDADEIVPALGNVLETDLGHG